MNDTSLLELIPDYALDTLSPADRAEVDGLLARSAEARGLLREYQETLDALALMVPTRRAPAYLTSDFKALLDAEIKGDRLTQDAAQQDAEESARLAEPPPAPLPPGTTLHVVGGGGTRRRWLPVALAAAVILLVIGVVIFFQNQARQAELAQIAAIVHDPAVQQRALTFTDPSVTAQVVVYMKSAQDADMVVSMAAMPPLPADKQYELWLIDANAPIAAGVYDPVSAATQVLLHLKAPIGTYKQVAISIEPRGGSSHPTTLPIAAAAIG
jgi:anti-sigma-K factor RskA